MYKSSITYVSGKKMIATMVKLGISRAQVVLGRKKAHTTT
jgi:hypothetical protein